MMPFLWIGLVGGSLGAGVSLAVLLVVTRRREGLVMAGGIASMALSVLAANNLVAYYDRPVLTVIASVIAVGSVGGGFALVSSLLSYVRVRPNTLTLPPPGDPGRSLVVLLADVEPDEYVAGEVTREIADLVDAGLPEPRMSVLPFHYAAQKARYRAVGGRSPEAGQAAGLAERLEKHLDPARFAGPVMVRCGDGSALRAALDSAHEAGYKASIAAGAYIAEGYRVGAERSGADTPMPELSLAYTRSLWASDKLANLVARRTLAARSDPERTGVALVVHGQPGVHERANRSFDIQENSFANRIRLFLIEEGLHGDRVRVCSAEWRDPGVTETVRHLAAIGCDRVLVVPACQPFANLQTLLDFAGAVRDARVPEDVRVVHIAPWGDDEVFAEVLAAAIEEAAPDAG